MSWLERARLSEASSSELKTNSERLGRAAAQLRTAVRSVISPDDIVAAQKVSLEGARNEIRSACRSVFEGESWDEFTPEEKDALVEDLLDIVFGFGPLENMLADDTITEVMVNGASSVFFERKGKLYPGTQVFSDDEQVRALIDRILGPLGRRIDEASPMVNARLPQGHRVHAIIPPLAIDGPCLTIRKFSKNVLKLESMVESNSIDANVRQLLEWAVLVRKNIAVSGGTGSGKTTLLNALSCVIPAGERIITIEDSAELRFLEHPHVVRLEARPRNAEGFGEVTIRDLVINALRMRPDRIVVGECRGAEALDMLQAMNTGHDGSLTTLHANSPAEVVSRLTTMVRYTADLPADVIEAYIASALDLVIQTARAVDGSRYVSDIVSFSYDAERRACVITPLYKRGPLEVRGTWFEEPAWLETVVAFGYAAREEVEAWRHRLSLAA